MYAYFNEFAKSVDIADDAVVATALWKDESREGRLFDDRGGVDDMHETSYGCKNAVHLGVTALDPSASHHSPQDVNDGHGERVIQLNIPTG